MRYFDKRSFTHTANLFFKNFTHALYVISNYTYTNHRELLSFGSIRSPERCIFFGKERADDG